MTARHLLAVTALLAVATAASAQPAPRPATGAAPGAQIQFSSGPKLPGVCTFSEGLVFGQSAVGRAVQTRMQQLGAQASAEIQPQEASIQADAHTLEGQKTTLDQATLNKRAADLDFRQSTLNKLAEQRQQELDYTQRKALARIHAELLPVLQVVYQQRNCSILIDDQSVLVKNEDMDVTGSVITALNGKIQTFTFDREPVPQGASGQ